MKKIRILHRKVSILFALPVLIIVVTGVLLILRSKLSWIQSPSPKIKSISIENMRSIPEVFKKLKIYQGLKLNKKDISSIIFKPSKNIFTVRTKDYREIIIHPETLEIINIGPKYSTLLIQIHEGTFFTSWARDFIFLPTSLALIFLWFSGLVIYFKTNRKLIRRA